MNTSATLFHPDHQELGLLELHSLDDTDRLAAALNTHLPPQACVGLVGTLGVGKTRLVQAFAQSLGLDGGDVTSPTFTMLQQYAAERRLYHLDAYRIADEDELWELGVEELFEEAAVMMIEWADRFADCMPRETLWLRMRMGEADSRLVQISGLSSWSPIVEDVLTSM